MLERCHICIRQWDDVWILAVAQAARVWWCQWNKKSWNKIHTPGSSNIADTWKMGAPDWVDVFPIKIYIYIFQPAMWSSTRGYSSQRTKKHETFFICEGVFQPGVIFVGENGGNHVSDQIIATSHDLGPQKEAKKGKSPYFRRVQFGEILQLGQMSWISSQMLQTFKEWGPWLMVSQFFWNRCVSPFHRSIPPKHIVRFERLYEKYSMFVFWGNQIFFLEI